MIERVIGTIEKVNGPIVIANGISDAMMMELVEVGEMRLIGEVVKLMDERAVIQIYEDATGLAPGNNIYGSGSPLSVEVGPGLLGSIYDGIQRPLNLLREATGDFIGRGVKAPSLPKEKKWDFTPVESAPQRVQPGTLLGTVPENEGVTHKILTPPNLSGRTTYLAPKGAYTVDETIAEIETSSGVKRVTMAQRWAIRTPRPVNERLPLEEPLVTGQRVIDTLFPLAKGGAVIIPGGFGTGKTMTQQAIAKWCDADIIIYIGCGERGNEMTDVLAEFPELEDPRTKRPLMERTVLIANTSNMPVSAREASIYTGITLAEYYRDQGNHVAIMADSTSRWAEALRELSGRMEEMPAEEGFPAYLPTRIAEFYERAGFMKTLSGDNGSVSVIGAVSPPGGDLSEPMTQHSRRFVRCFWALDRNLANARHYPAIGWIESYSEYVGDVAEWWKEKSGGDWYASRQQILHLLQKEVRLEQVVKLVGPDALPDSQRFILEVCSLFKIAFLQQNAFDTIDRFSTAAKQQAMLDIILLYWNRGLEAIQRGVTIQKLKKIKIIPEIARMKLAIENDDLKGFDKLTVRLEKALDRLESVFD